MANLQALREAIDSIEGTLQNAAGHKAPAGGCSHNHSSSSDPKMTLPCMLLDDSMNRRELSQDIEDSDRGRLIRSIEQKWVNGTELTFSFFRNGEDVAGTFDTSGTIELIKNAFQIWADVGIGIKFREVANVNDAQIRIGFARRTLYRKSPGNWSYVGRAILDPNGTRTDPRTMNFNEDLTRRSNGIDTAIHEIGHTLGFNHEHQNPRAGIEWNADAVYRAFGNNPRQIVFNNILRKIPADTVDGSSFDKDSIMCYAFPTPGLIRSPSDLRSGFTPRPGLSELDKKTALKFYPQPDEMTFEKLVPNRTIDFEVEAGTQQDFIFEPEMDGRYKIRTLGFIDTVMTLNEDIKGEKTELAEDDDSGSDRNAMIEANLLKGRKYILSVRLYFSFQNGPSSILLENISDN